MKKLVALLAAIVLLFGACCVSARPAAQPAVGVTEAQPAREDGPADENGAEPTEEAEATPAPVPAPMSGEIGTDDISKTGNITLSVSCRDFLDAGYQFGDIVTLAFSDKALDLPFGSSYSDVDTGEPILAAREKDNKLKAAINMGDFATACGIAVKTVHEDETVSWEFPGNTEGRLSFTISMKEPGGYYGQYVAHQLSYTDERSDYPGLTDEQFANFRVVQTAGMGKDTLYRTASPVNPKHGRNAYADEALKNHGVTVIMDLVDDEASLTAFPGYEESCYHTVRHIALNMGTDFTAADYREKLARGLRFFAENPGVYAVHCLEGKDRTGVVCALLECLMGAPLEEAVADYMLTFRNYYGVEPGDAKYDVISQGNVVKNLQKLFGTEDLEGADLSACAEEFIRGIGLSDTELQNLKANLRADHS
ncbi:MAG: tyrosine-protein phosphatase [Oscillospiraceae bacterium]|nr:tyrosine-protein phosphatase [Oscillospiraceae bacterium]